MFVYSHLLNSHRLNRVIKSFFAIPSRASDLAEKMGELQESYICNKTMLITNFAQLLLIYIYFIRLEAMIDNNCNSVYNSF